MDLIKWNLDWVIIDVIMFVIGVVFISWDIREIKKDTLQ